MTDRIALADRLEILAAMTDSESLPNDAARIQVQASIVRMDLREAAAAVRESVKVSEALTEIRHAADMNMLDKARVIELCDTALGVKS